ncbi:toll-like receptor 4 [Diadema antillarum]|uniref:toll-like receptor 4 n=1 Tax=Diadema antillarum TaxID=105358 RepID=UPI003A8ADFCE
MLKALPKLQYLDVSNNPISWMSIDQFTHNAVLEELRMERGQLLGRDLFDNSQNMSIFRGLASLGKLRLKGNFLHQLDLRTFSNLSNLYYLDMSESRITVLVPRIFKDLHSLKFLYLNDNKLLALNGDVFQGLGSLTVLLIQNNSLSKIEKQTFAPTPELRALYLPGNHINTILPGTFFPTTDHSLSIDISRNPISCTCELQWFRNWLHTANIRIEHPDRTLCSSASLQVLKNKPLLSFDPGDFCGVDTALITGLSLTGAAVFLLTVLAYINRWWLNYKFFLLKLALFGYKEVEEDVAEEDYRYQLNVMFHDDDEGFVNDILRPALMQRMPHLQHIIYGDDDLNVGMFYVDALYHAIESSYKSVLLISNQSVGDVWFMTKLRMALEHLNETRLDKIILVFLEDIEDDNLPYLVRLFLSRNRPYMLWTEDEDGQELFWATLEKNMRTNRVLNNIIPV